MYIVCIYTLSSIGNHKANWPFFSRLVNSTQSSQVCFSKKKIFASLNLTNVVQSRIFGWSFFELCVIFFFSFSSLGYSARSRSFVEKVYKRSGGGCWQQLTQKDSKLASHASHSSPTQPTKCCPCCRRTTAHAAARQPPPPCRAAGALGERDITCFQLGLARSFVGLAEGDKSRSVC